MSISAKHLILSVGLIVATASMAEASSFVINTDATWLAKNSTPAVGWNGAFAFDTAADGGWQAAQNNAALPCGLFGCMVWWDGQFSATEQVWLRKTFVLDGPVVSGFIQGGIDDDAMIWINGTLVYNVFDGLAGSFGFNIAPFLAPGNNLIAVFADDNLFWGQNHQFTAQLTIDTAAAAAVPEPSALVLLGSGLAVVAATLRGRRRR
jgi:hypothetical protein